MTAPSRSRLRKPILSRAREQAVFVHADGSAADRPLAIQVDSQLFQLFRIIAAVEQIPLLGTL